VSIGKRRITATKAGETSLSRTVEVPAGETASVALVSTGAPAASRDTAGADASAPTANGGGGNPLLVAGWIGTGVLAVGAVVTGVLAASAASDLKDARNAFPGNKSDIDSKASTTTAFAVTTDVLGAAAIILGGVSLYFTLTSPSKSGQNKPPASGIQVGGGPGRMTLGGTF
jgi:hypothetical protein